MTLIAALPAAAADPFDSTWCEVDAGEFRLITDQPREAAEDAVWRLKTFRPVAESYLPGEPGGRSMPLTILLFERGRDYRFAFDGPEMVAFMQPSFDENLMVVGQDPRAFTPHESLFHEYVHYLLRTRTGISIPTWFDEGMASMLSTARVTADEVTVGELPTDPLEASMRDSRLKLSTVLDASDMWGWHPDRRVGFYSWSWVLVHRMVLGNEAERRADYRPGLEAFLAGRAESLPDALGVPVGRLDRHLERYIERRGITRSHAVEQPVEGGGTFRCLDETDKVIELSRAVAAHNPELASRHLRRLLADQPDHPRLWAMLSLAAEAADDRDGALEAARRAVGLAPNDTAAAVRLAAALSMGCILEVSDACLARWREAVPLLRRALRENPTQQEAIFILGLAYLYSGRPGDALNYLRIANQRQPWAPQVNFYLGQCYRLIGDSRAREHLTRAVRWSPTELWRRLAEAGLAALDSPG